MLRAAAREQHVARSPQGRRSRLAPLLRASQAVGSGRASGTPNQVPRSSAFARAFERRSDGQDAHVYARARSVGCCPEVTIARLHSTIRVKQGLRIPSAGLLLSAHMSTPTVITPPTWATGLPVTSVPYVTNPAQRCSGALGHIYGLAEDGEWHCHLPQGHDGVCLALDGTRW